MREIVQFQYDRGLMEVSLEKLENLFRLSAVFLGDVETKLVKRNKDGIKDWKKVTTEVSEIARVLKEGSK